MKHIIPPRHDFRSPEQLNLSALRGRECDTARGQSSTPCCQAAERLIVAEAIRASVLLLFGVECIRGPFIRLNLEELRSTANGHQIEM